MQNRYVGDIGDYLKLAILRKLAKNRRLGVAWWLVDDESHNADGGHREYLDRPEQWKHLDPELFEALVKISKAKRNIRALENAGLLRDAVFACEKVPCDVRPFKDRPDARKRWLSEIGSQLKNCDMVFLDPDNGIAPEGLRLTRRPAGKSVFIEDVKALTGDERALVVYHHQTRRKGGHYNELCHLSQRLSTSGFRVGGVLRAKPWSPRAFFILNADTDFCARAKKIAEVWDNLISWYSTESLQQKAPSPSLPPPLW